MNVYSGDIDVAASDDGVNAANSTLGERSDKYAINIAGGDLYIDAGSDGLDSNNDINITGGKVEVYGADAMMDAAIDYDGTFTLSGGTLFGAAVGVLLGIIAAIHRNKFADNLIMVLSLLTVSTPSFFLALILMLIFCLNLRWLPSIGMDTWQGAVLPIATLGLQAIGSIARTTRSAMLDVIHQDYIRTSRSRGVPERVITYRHAFKNAPVSYTHLTLPTT